MRGQRHDPAASCTMGTGKEPVPIVQEAGWAPGPVWTGAENLAPTGIGSPDHPPRIYMCVCVCKDEMWAAQIPGDMSVRWRLTFVGLQYELASCHLIAFRILRYCLDLWTTLCALGLKFHKSRIFLLFYVDMEVQGRTWLVIAALSLVGKCT